MNEISIIINGVRYDAVDASVYNFCGECDFSEICSEVNFYDSVCPELLNGKQTFKKSTKSFER